MRPFIPYLLFFGVLLFVLSGYDTIHKRGYHAEEMKVSFSLDSIPPGPITQKQAASLRVLNVNCPGIKCGPKSFTLAIAPKGGPAHFMNCVGNQIPEPALIYLRKAKPGDLIIIANVMLFNNIKYKAVSDPTWTVIADAK